MLVSSVVGLCITGAGVIYVALTLRATKAALEVANRSANAAEAAIEDARGNAQRELRAYLSATPHFDGSEIDKRPPHYVITIKNRGQTPAYNVRGWTDGVLVDHPADELPVGRRPFMAPKVLNPGEKLGLNGYYERALSIDEAQKVLEGGKRFYFWGEVTYQDAFKQPRFLRFKYVFGGISARSGRGIDTADDGNEAD